MTDYDNDFFEWTQETARAIAAGRFSEIDRVALADEVESLGKRDRREVSGRLGVILLHMLKWDHQPELQSRSWTGSIRRERGELEAVLLDSPSLRRQVPELLPAAYRKARREAADETGIPLKSFPEACPWTVEQILAVDN